MKLRIILFFAIICMVIAGSSPLQAQSHYDANISVGMRAGADLSKNFFNPYVKQSLRPGGSAGITFRYIEENHFGLIAELEYMQRGWKENFEEAPYNYSHALDYIQLPILAHIYFGRRLRGFANVGPYFALRTGGSVSSNFDTSDTSQLPDFPRWHNTKQYTEPITQKFDYGICAGLGGEFNITSRHSLTIECRFYYGLGNIFGSSRRDTFNASNSMALSFNVGYWLRLK